MIGPLARLSALRLGAAERLGVRLGERSGVAAIHDFRVAVRRLQLTLRLIGPGTESARDLARLARYGERLFSPVRNCDVAAQRARELKEGREAADVFVERQRRLRRRKLAAAAAKWRPEASAWALACGAVRRDLAKGSAAQAALKLDAYRRARARRCLKLAPGLSLDSPEEAWHALRKDLRLLRYASDDLRAAAGRPSVAEVDRLVQVQRVLGDANDLAVLERKLARMSEKFGPHSPFEPALEAMRREAAQRRVALLRSFPREALEDVLG